MKPQKANVGVRRLVGAGVELEHSAPGGEQVGLEDRLRAQLLSNALPSIKSAPNCFSSLSWLVACKKLKLLHPAQQNEQKEAGNATEPLLTHPQQA